MVTKPTDFDHRAKALDTIALVKAQGGGTEECEAVATELKKAVNGAVTTSNKVRATQRGSFWLIPSWFHRSSPFCRQDPNALKEDKQMSKLAGSNCKPLRRMQVRQGMLFRPLWMHHKPWDWKPS